MERMEFHKGYEEAGENKEIAQGHQRIIEQPGTERRRHVLVEFPVEICPADQGNKVNAAESGRGNDQEFYKQAEKRSAAASFHNGKTDSRQDRNKAYELRKSHEEYGKIAVGKER